MSVETVRGIRYVKFLPLLKHKQVRDIATQAVVGFPEVHVGVLAPNVAILSPICRVPLLYALCRKRRIRSFFCLCRTSFWGCFPAAKIRTFFGVARFFSGGGGCRSGVGTWRGPSIDEPRKERVGLRCWFSVCCESAISGCRSIFASLFSRGGAACLTVGSMPLIHSDI